MAQQRPARRIIAKWFGNSDDFYDYARAPAKRVGRRFSRDVEAIAVTDDWPEVLPITVAELRVMESHFSAELDELFGPRV